MVHHETPTPLVPESLVRFYRRVARAFRAPPSAQALAIAELSRVVELHHAAAAAIAAAAACTTDEVQRHWFRELSSAQTRLADRMGELVREFGGEPPPAGQSRASLMPYTARDMDQAPDPTALSKAVRDDLIHLDLARRAVVWSSRIPPKLRERIQAFFESIDDSRSGAGFARVDDEALMESFPASEPPLSTLGDEPAPGRALTAGDVMSTSAPVVERATRLDLVARELRATGARMAVVTDGGGHVLGVLTRGDIAVRASADRLRVELTRAAAIMTTELVRCDPADDIEAVVSLMQSHLVPSVLVTTGRRMSLRGSIGIREIAGAISPERFVDLVTALSVPVPGTRGDYDAR